MPPLSVPSTRASRSRIASPLPGSVTTNETGKPQNNTSTGTGTSGGGQQTLLGWLEPPVNMKASFQDAGLQRHGVVENMAPLGTMPKVGIFKKAAPPPPAIQSQDKADDTAGTVTVAAPPPPVRKIILKRSVPAATPTPAPAMPSTPVTPIPEADETEEEEIEDTDVDDMDEDTLQGYGSGRPPGTVFPQMPSSHVVQRVIDRRLLDQVVERAVNEALDHARYPTAYALRTLYDEQSSDPEQLALFARWLTQMVDGEGLEYMSRLVYAKKREGAQNQTAYHYFVPPNNATPPDPKPSPYAHLVGVDLTKLHVKGERPARPAQAAQASAQPADSAESAQPDAMQQHQYQHQQQEQAQSSNNTSESAAPSPEPRRSTTSGPMSKPPPPSSPVMAAISVTQPATPSPPPEEKTKPTPRSARKRKSRHSETVVKTANKGKSKPDSPVKRRTRRDSQSSSSTLSSARSLSPPADAFSVPTSRASPAVVEESPAEVIDPPPKRRRTQPPRKSGNASPREQPSSPAVAATVADSVPAAAGDAVAVANPQPAPFTMPEALNSPMFPNLNGGKKGKGTQRIVFPSKVGVLDEDDELLGYRKRAMEHTAGANHKDSYSRDPMPAVASTSISASAPPTMEPEPEQPVVVLDPPPRARTALPTGRSGPQGRSTRATRKRSHDDVDDQPSPTLTTFLASEAVSTAPNSRSGTPARATKKPRTSVRIKTSPVKKKTGTAAGAPRPSGDRSSPAVNGAAKEDENDDYCSSCSGNGQLICCDGCTRSLHIFCIDPPIYEHSMPQQWFCNECRSKQHPPPVFKGPFRELLTLLEPKNSTPFMLPKETRERFENVRTGPDGEYEEIKPPPPKTTKKKKTDEEQTLEYHRLRDPSHDDRIILCHACLTSCTDSRPIVPCPDCGLYWHIDCVDPPMPHIPSVLRDWRCPAHVDDLVKQLPGTLAPAHKHRQIKGAPVITPAFSRGNVNNGFIEVDWDDEEDEPDMPPVQDHSGWRSVSQFGKTVKLSGRGIQKDFLSRSATPASQMFDLGLNADMPPPSLRRNRKGKVIAPLHSVPTPTPPQIASPLPRDVLERQLAAYTLAQLPGRNTANISSLIDNLVTQAGPTVNALIARDASDRMTRTMDPEELHETVGLLETLIANIRTNMAAVGRETPATPALDGSAVPEAEVPSLTSSQSSSVASDNLAQEDLEPPTAAAANKLDLKKDLPSPTGDVNGVAPRDDDAALEADRGEQDETTLPAATDGADPMDIE